METQIYSYPSLCISLIVVLVGRICNIVRFSLLSDREWGSWGYEEILPYIDYTAMCGMFFSRFGLKWGRFWPLWSEIVYVLSTLVLNLVCIL